MLLRVALLLSNLLLVFQIVLRGLVLDSFEGELLLILAACLSRKMALLLSPCLHTVSSMEPSTYSDLHVLVV